jgi:hypothetical protein
MKSFFRILDYVSNISKRRPFSADFSRGNSKKSVETKSGERGRCYSVVTLLFAKKALNKTDRCAGALS